MKFQQFSAMQKHIQSSFSLKQIPRSYLIIHPQREERRKLLEKLSKEIASHVSNACSTFLEAEQVEWEKVHERLATPSLFGEEEIVIWNGLKTLAEPVLEKSIGYILAPSSQAFFLMGAAGGKGLSNFYQKTKQELVILDFSEEKPWDKQRRVQQELLEMVEREGKRISPGAYAALMSISGTDPLILESELIKLMSYVGDRREIQLEDVKKMASPSAEASGWQLAEALVWEGEIKASSTIDLSFLLALVGQLRFLLNQGRVIGWVLQKKISMEDAVTHYPQLKPALVQKMEMRFRSRQMAYFENALEALYELEILMKNSTLSPEALFSLLQTKLIHLKKIYTR